ncbi:MAG: hypothetical protein K6U87_12440 [Firmicutes bacterium]|nr:hypothetical protein [Bacillota bacterium]
MRSWWGLLLISLVGAWAGMYCLGRLEWLWAHPPSAFYTGFAAQLDSQILPPFVALAEGLLAAYALFAASAVRPWQAATMSLLFLAWMAQIAVEPGMLSVVLWLVSHLENNYSNWIPGLWAAVYLGLLGKSLRHRRFRELHPRKAET